MSTQNVNFQQTAWLKTVGGNIRRERVARGLTQEKLAELAELAPRTVQKIEAGRITILITTLRRLRQAIGCPYEALLREGVCRPAASQGTAEKAAAKAAKGK
ncbi:MAG: helix-turn-helix domain-containing protein [Opitutaceae bacterium]|nr:helix-turn-helix domain-containing protein [Opitutaceae bacterium]